MQRLISCFCGWQGYNVVSSGGKPILCPSCGRAIQPMNCVGGCGE